MYKHDDNNDFMYSKRQDQRFSYSDPVETFPIVVAAPVSMSMVANNYKIEVQALQFDTVPLIILV